MLPNNGIKRIRLRRTAYATIVRLRGFIKINIDIAKFNMYISSVHI